MAGMFVETNHIDSLARLKGVSFKEFKQILLDQKVCLVSMSNAKQWYKEVPRELHGAYLKKRDHRVRGALLHTDALALVHSEAEAMEKHPFAMK